MAPLDPATTLLSTLSDAIRESYYQDLIEGAYRFGQATNRIFNPTTEKINGDGRNFQAMNGRMYSAQVSRDLYADAVAPRSPTVGRFKARVDETSGGPAGDVSAFDNAIETGWVDLERAADGGEHAIGDLAEKLTQEMIDDDSELLAKLRNLPSTGLIGAISGGLKADGTTYAEAGSFSSGVYGRIQLPDTVPMAMFARNVLIDIYDASTQALNATVIVNHVNGDDQSLSIQLVDSNGERTETGNLVAADIAATDTVYLHGSRNKGMKSLGDWMVAEGTSGESFFNIDRTVGTNRWMLPTVVGPATAQVLSHRYIRDLGRALHVTKGEEVDGPAYVMQSGPRMHDTFIDIAAAETINHFANDEARGERMVNFGYTGAMYSDPYLGKVGLEMDALCPDNLIRALRLGDWQTLTLMDQMFKMLPAEFGNFYRKSTGTADGARSKVFRADRTGYACDVCLQIHRQGLIRNVLPAAA